MKIDKKTGIHTALEKNNNEMRAPYCRPLAISVGALGTRGSIDMEDRANRTYE